nr:hypothetical protein [Tanacetum cinerariifolium]
QHRGPLQQECNSIILLHDREEDGGSQAEKSLYVTSLRVSNQFATGMASCLVQSFSSSSTKEDVVGNKKCLAPSQSDSQEPKLVVPKNLYLFIQEALLLEKQIKEGRREMDFESKRQDVMTKIDELTTIYTKMEWLPFDWKYHLDTASICVPKKSHPVSAEKKPKKIPLCPRLAALFTKTALEDLSILTVEQDKTPLTTTSDFVCYIGAFAVDVFNKCYQMYINKGIKKNVSDAKIMDCKYLKFEDDYLFYVTLKAIEQENRGVYETTIKCEFDDGAISVDTFILKYRKPS